MVTSRRIAPRSETAPVAPPPRRSAAATSPWSSAMGHQLECATLGTVAVLKSAEALHRFLLDSTHSARKRHEAIRSRVHAALSLEQMAALQAELWSYDADIAVRYWEEMADAAAHMNAELFDQTSKALGWWLDDAQASLLGKNPFDGGTDVFSELMRSLAVAAVPARPPARLAAAG